MLRLDTRTDINLKLPHWVRLIKVRLEERYVVCGEKNRRFQLSEQYVGELTRNRREPKIAVKSVIGWRNRNICDSSNHERIQYNVKDMIIWCWKYQNAWVKK